MKRKIIFALAIILYRVLLDINYEESIAPYWSYFRLISQQTNESNFISWCFLVSLIPIVYKNVTSKKTVTSYAAFFLFMICVVPLTSYLNFAPQSFEFIFLSYIYWLLLFLFLLYIRIKPYHPIRNAEQIIAIIAIVIISSVIIVSGVYAKFRLHFDLQDVYGLRMESREFKMPIILKYIHAAAGNVLPLLMMYFLFKKNKLMIYFIAFIGLLEFSIAGQKSAIFKIVFCLILCFWKNINYKKAIIPAFVILCISALVEEYFCGYSMISNMVIRRVLYIPQMLNTVFYDYVINHGPIFFEPKFFGQLNYIIGDIYFGHSEMSANNGLFTDAVVNLGWFGCLFYPFLLGIFFNMCEAAFVNKNKGVVIYTTLISVTTFMSSVFTTALLTHAVAATCLMVYLMPNDRTNK